MPMMISSPHRRKRSSLPHMSAAGDDDGGNLEKSWPEDITLPEQLSSKAVQSLHARIDREWGPLLRSACQTAAGRALWKHVVGDPIAGVLAGESCLRSLYGKMRKDKLSNAREVSGVLLAIRTLWFDSKIEAAVHSSSSPSGLQIVLLGSGMDARGYRLECLRESSVFEVDFGELLEVKAALLQEAMEMDGREEVRQRAKRMVRVAADLREDGWVDKLQAKGFCPGKSTVWVLEGLLYYLTREEAMEVLRLIAGNISAARTVLLADFMNASSISLCRSLFQFHCDWPDQLLQSLGFTNVNLSQIGDPDAHFGLLEDPQNLFHRIRKLPRSIQVDPEDGTPCQRLYLVQAS